MIQKSGKILALLLVALLMVSLLGMLRPTEVLADGIFEADEEVMQEESKLPESEQPAETNNTTAADSSANRQEPTTEEVSPAGYEDGSYVPSFGFTGGSGRVVISCPEVTVTDGKALATLVFSSSKYTRVTVDGVDYANDNAEGNSAFTVPVKLNGTTVISAETTAMSQPHDIEYVLYVYTDGSDVADISPEAAANAAQTGGEGEDAEADTVETNPNDNSWGDYNSEQSPDGDEPEKTAPEEAATDAGKSLPTVAVLGGLVVVVGGLVSVINAIDKKKKANR